MTRPVGNHHHRHIHPKLRPGRFLVGKDQNRVHILPQQRIKALHKVRAAIAPEHCRVNPVDLPAEVDSRIHRTEHHP